MFQNQFYLIYIGNLNYFTTSAIFRSKIIPYYWHKITNNKSEANAQKLPGGTLLYIYIYIYTHFYSGFFLFSVTQALRGPAATIFFRLELDSHFNNSNNDNNI